MMLDKIILKILHIKVYYFDFKTIVVEKNYLQPYRMERLYGGMLYVLIAH